MRSPLVGLQQLRPRMTRGLRWTWIPPAGRCCTPSPEGPYACLTTFLTWGFMTDEPAIGECVLTVMSQ